MPRVIPAGFGTHAIATAANAAVMRSRRAIAGRNSRVLSHGIQRANETHGDIDVVMSGVEEEACGRKKPYPHGRKNKYRGDCNGRSAWSGLGVTAGSFGTQ